MTYFSLLSVIGKVPPRWVTGVLSFSAKERNEDYLIYLIDPIRSIEEKIEQASNQTDLVTYHGPPGLTQDFSLG